MHLVDDPERHHAEMTWLNGGSALALVRLHVSRGETLEAATVARAALEMEGCPDAAEIEALLYQLDAPPEDWLEILREFAGAPSVERWRDIMRFVPPDDYYQRLRNSIRRLKQLGTDTNILFLCACELGMTPDAIQLVEEGLVDVEVIEERATRAGGAAATYIGLAAIAAFCREDIVGTIRLLRQSLANETDLCPAFPHIWFIRERASPEVNAMLDQAGIPDVRSSRD
jgi:hypothetical protein